MENAKIGVIRRIAIESKQLMQKLNNHKLSFIEAKQFFSKIFESDILQNLLSFRSRATLSVLFSQCLKEFAPEIPLDSQFQLDQMLFISCSVLNSLTDTDVAKHQSALSIIENFIAIDAYFLFNSETAKFVLEILSRCNTEQSVSFIINILENVRICSEDWFDITKISIREPLALAIKSCSQNLRSIIINTARMMGSKMYQTISEAFGMIDDVNDLFNENSQIRLKFIRNSTKFVENENMHQIIVTILSRHIDSNEEVRLSVLNIAESIISIPVLHLIPSALDAVSERLNDESPKVRLKALKIICSQTNLPESLISKGIQRINDKSDEIANLAIQLALTQINHIHVTQSSSLENSTDSQNSDIATNLERECLIKIIESAQLNNDAKIAMQNAVDTLGLRRIISLSGKSPKSIANSLSQSIVNAFEILSCDCPKIVKFFVFKYRNLLEDEMNKMIFDGYVTDEILTALNYIDIKSFKNIEKYLIFKAQHGIFFKALAKIPNADISNLRHSDKLKYAVLSNNKKLCLEFQQSGPIKWRIRAMFITNTLRNLEFEHNSYFVINCIKSKVNDQKFLVDVSKICPKDASETFFNMSKMPNCPHHVIVAYALFATTKEGSICETGVKSIIGLRKKYGINIDFKSLLQNENIDGVDLQQAACFFK